MWRLAAQYRSPGCSGNLASLQCQLGCLLSQGKHLPTHTHTVASCARAFPCICYCMGRSHKCDMNLTNITSLYGYSIRATSLPTASKMPYGRFPREPLQHSLYRLCSHSKSLSLKSNNLTLKCTIPTDLYSSATWVTLMEHNRLNAVVVHCTLYEHCTWLLSMWHCYRHLCL
jgi:hypothetical protein